MPIQAGQLLDFNDTRDGETAIRRVQVAFNGARWKAAGG